ncbi:HCLS1-binding protein 3 [Hypanus sabinus]|uniref:HCLS1-binding protein 3 n=1 Tax=Hypanus sabinus TaxID=79690 RepID=UPI0028C48EE8|nr:HCLS1-binding protein 3 [Hypanus sabinus]
MPEGLITSRTVQNATTGIDLSVPEYQEIHGKMMSGHVEYQIVVVTHLASFKSTKHKPKDVIQFVVSKKYSEIDELCQKLSTRYSKAKIPSMPRKVLFVAETDIKERRVVFDEIFRSIAKDTVLASSPELLEFLGGKTKELGDLKYKTGSAADDLKDDDGDSGDFFGQETSQDTEILRESKNILPSIEKCEEISDPLGVTRYKVKSTEPSQQKMKHKFTLFEEVDADAGLFEPVKGSSTTALKKSPFQEADCRLFEDPDLGGSVRSNDPLLIPSNCELKGDAITVNLDEDTEELLRVEDDLDKILNLSSSNKAKPAKPTVPAKPAVPAKPTVTKKPACPSEMRRTSPAAESSSSKNTVAAMNELDILKYIQENEASSTDSLDLF